MSLLVFVFCYVVAVYGASTVMVFGSGPFKILEKIRVLAFKIHPHFGLLFSCMLCFPTNLGIVLSLLGMFVTPIPITPFTILFYGHFDYWWLIFLLDGAFAAGSTWFLHNILELFIKKSDESTVVTAQYTQSIPEEDVIDTEDITKK